MYEQFFGLAKSPFGINPDPTMLYPMEQTKEAFAGLLHGILNRKGFVVLTGDSGTGKTTLLRAVLSYVSKDKLQSSLVFNPTLSPAEFLEMAMYDFGIEDVAPTKVKRILQLQRFLVDANENGKICVLFVDEAHKLSPEVLEEIRLLTNLEDEKGKLLQIVLAGHEELDQILDQRDFRQLKQRVAVRVSLRALTLQEVIEYMAARWEKAGAQNPLPFRPEALARIASVSGGIPRVINVIADNALLSTYGAGSDMVTERQIIDTARDLRVGTVTEPQAGGKFLAGMEERALTSQVLVGNLNLPPPVTERDGSESAGRVPREVAPGKKGRPRKQPAPRFGLFS